MTDTPATPAALAALFKAAKPGDRILCAPGIYPALRLTMPIPCEPPIVVASADPASPAVFKGGLQLVAMGAVFKGVSFDVSETSAAWGAALNINGGHDVTIDRCAFKGRATTTGEIWGYGFVAKGVRRLTITNSTFTKLSRGGVVSATSAMMFADNDMTDLGSDGLSLGGVTSSSIVRNSFVGFTPTATDHPDGIQGMQVDPPGWTGPPSVNRNLFIADNLIRSLTPGRGPQGIFFPAENKVRGGPFTVKDNLLINTGYRGISFSTMDFVNVSGNRVLFEPDPTGVAGYSGIIFQNSTGTATNNQAVRITLGAVADGGGNVIIPQSTAAEVEAAAAAWRAKHRAPAFDPMARIAELEARLAAIHALAGQP